MTLRPSTQWRPDRAFWVSHALAPGLAAIALLFAVEHSGLDLWLASHWYAIEGGGWNWRDHWLAQGIIHHRGRQLVLTVGLAVLALWLASLRVPALRAWRRPLAYLFVSLVVLPSIVALTKRASPVPCPWDLAPFGGELPYRHNFAYAWPALADGGHCFPAGHASGGFALVSLYFAAHAGGWRRAWLLLPGLAVGIAFALGQQARGAHFLSHDLWSLSVCWFGALALFALMRPWKASASAPPGTGR